MEKSNSLNILNRKKLIVCDKEYLDLQKRKLSNITCEVKIEAKSQSNETIVSVSDFLKMPENETQKYDDVEFNNVKIDEGFVVGFPWKLKDSVNLTFNNCVCIDGYTFKDLFASTDVANLKMISCGLTNDEAIYIICNLYPWTLESVTFTNESIDKEFVVKVVTEKSVIYRDILMFN